MIDGSRPEMFEEGNGEKKPEREEVEANGKGMDSKIKMLLPCDHHPFDQFLVKTKIEVPVDFDEE